MKYNCFDVNFQYEINESDNHVIRYDDESTYDSMIEAFEYFKKCARKANGMCDEDGFIKFDLTVWFYDDKGIMHNLLSVTSKYGYDWNF